MLWINVRPNENFCLLILFTCAVTPSTHTTAYECRRTICSFVHWAMLYGRYQGWRGTMGDRVRERVAGSEREREVLNFDWLRSFRCLTFLPFIVSLKRHTTLIPSASLFISFIISLHTHINTLTHTSSQHVSSCVLCRSVALTYVCQWNRAQNEPNTDNISEPIEKRCNEMRKEMNSTEHRNERKKCAAQTAYIQHMFVDAYFYNKSKYPKSNNKNNSIQNEHSSRGTNIK